MTNGSRERQTARNVGGSARAMIGRNSIARVSGAVFMVVLQSSIVVDCFDRITSGASIECECNAYQSERIAKTGAGSNFHSTVG